MIKLKSYIDNLIGFIVYCISFPDINNPKIIHKYYGHTSDFFTRMGVHSKRFDNKMQGGSAYLYEEARSHINSIYEAKFEILARFDTKAEAEKLEKKLRRIDGDLNTIL